METVRNLVRQVMSDDVCKDHVAGAADQAHLPIFAQTKSFAGPARIPRRTREDRARIFARDVSVGRVRVDLPGGVFSTCTFQIERRVMRVGKRLVDDNSSAAPALRGGTAIRSGFSREELDGGLANAWHLTDTSFPFTHPSGDGSATLRVLPGLSGGHPQSLTPVGGQHAV